MNNKNNIMAIYKITGKYMNGVNTEAYHLEDIYGNQGKKSKAEVIELALRGEIYNCVAVVCDDKVYLKGTNGTIFSELPIMKEKWEIVSRLVHNTGLVGYAVQNHLGKQYRLSLDKIWSLARQESVVNASAKLSKGRKVVCGEGIDLKNLPVIYV